MFIIQSAVKRREEVREAKAVASYDVTSYIKNARCKLATSNKQTQ